MCRLTVHPMRQPTNNYGLKKNTQSTTWASWPLLRVLLFLCVLFFAFSVLTTQDLANRFNYHASLGLPLWNHWYQPFAWIVWYQQWESLHGQTFNASIRWNLNLVGLFTAITLILYFLSFKSRRDIHLELHGSAHWASFAEVREMNLLQPGTEERGVVVGGFAHKGVKYYLKHVGPEHVLVFAPTRSGKGVGLVIPTLLSWPESAVVLDIKNELWDETAGWRKKEANNRVLRFNPACNDGTAACFNPLDVIRLGTDYAVSDAENIALMIIDDQGKGMDRFFEPAAYDFLVGLILHECYRAKLNGKHASLPDISLAMADPDSEDIHDKIDEMFTTLHHDGVVDPVIAQAAKGLPVESAKTLVGVLSTIRIKLTLYRNPIVAKNISRSDFSVNDLMNHDQPLSLYLCTPAGDMTRMKPLTRLVMTLILRGLTQGTARSGHTAPYKHRLLLMADEFPSLGKLEALEDSLPILAGYGVSCYLITQALTQLNKAYGRDNSIMDNCHVRTAYAPNTIETASILSKMTGTMTVNKKNVSDSRSSKGGILSSSSQNISYQETSRPLLTPDEVMRLKSLKVADDRPTTPGDMLVFVAGEPPIYGEQIVYFMDPILAARNKITAPLTSDRCGDLVESNGEATLSERFQSRLETAELKQTVKDKQSSVATRQ